MIRTRIEWKITLLCMLSLAVFGCGQKSIDEQLAGAQRSLEAGEVRVASLTVRNVLQSEPGNINARRLLGRIGLSEGDYLTAEAEFSSRNRIG